MTSNNYEPSSVRKEKIIMPTVKILSLNDRFARVRFPHSGSNSRISTRKLISDYENGKIDIANETLLAPYIDE